MDVFIKTVWLFKTWISFFFQTLSDMQPPTYEQSVWNQPMLWIRHSYDAAKSNTSFHDKVHVQNASPQLFELWGNQGTANSFPTLLDFKTQAIFFCLFHKQESGVCLYLPKRTLAEKWSKKLSKEYLVCLIKANSNDDFLCSLVSFSALCSFMNLNFPNELFM